MGSRRRPGLGLDLGFGFSDAASTHTWLLADGTFVDPADAAAHTATVNRILTAIDELLTAHAEDTAVASPSPTWWSDFAAAYVRSRRFRNMRIGQMDLELDELREDLAFALDAHIDADALCAWIEPVEPVGQVSGWHLAASIRVSSPPAPSGNRSFRPEHDPVVDGPLDGCVLCQDPFRIGAQTWWDRRGNRDRALRLTWLQHVRDPHLADACVRAGISLTEAITALEADPTGQVLRGQADAVLALTRSC